MISEFLNVSAQPRDSVDSKLQEPEDGQPDTEVRVAAPLVCSGLRVVFSALPSSPLLFCLYLHL
jgi:hypothetical protein